MKKPILLIALMASLAFLTTAQGEDSTTIVSSHADGLDLTAVSELFKETKNLEEFERTLNDPELGVNNLDLDGNGEVDFIRIVEEVAEDTHIIILQAAIGEDEFQDVATIEVEKSGDDYNLQVHGNEVIYGSHYYIAPTHVHVHTWPIIGWIYRPVYRPYRSIFHFGHRPHWWRPFHPVHFNVYHKHTARWRGHNTFVVARTSRVHTVGRVKYKPRTSVKVNKRVGVKQTTTSGGRTTTVSKGVKRTSNNKTGKTTVAKGKKKTITNKNGKTTTVKKGKKVTTNKNGKKTTVKKGKKVTKNKNGKKTVKKGKKKTVKKKK